MERACCGRTFTRNEVTLGEEQRPVMPYNGDGWWASVPEGLQGCRSLVQLSKCGLNRKSAASGCWVCARLLRPTNTHKPSSEFTPLSITSLSPRSQQPRRRCSDWQEEQRPCEHTTGCGGCWTALTLTNLERSHGQQLTFLIRSGDAHPVGERLPLYKYTHIDSIFISITINSQSRPKF